MKLLGCHIENYGTLSDFSLRFDDGITVINEENGFGKSTLASFIKAMLYGLPQTTKRKVEENERLLRTPWQGGSFGGSLEFEAKGKSYRLERFFGSKAAEDTFTLFDLETGKETDDFSSNIGIELFGIDAAGYERSVYLPQLDMSTESNDSIMTKLTDLVEDNDDINNYENAVARIEKRKSELTKSNGKRGSLAELCTQLETLRSELHDSTAAYDALDQWKARKKEYTDLLEKYRSELKSVRGDLSAASSAAAALEQKKRRDELEDEIKSISQRLDGINKKYPLGLPESSELEAMTRDADRLKELLNEYKVLSAELNGDTEKLAKLSEMFGNGNITDALLTQKRDEVSRLNSLKITAAAKREVLRSEDGAQKATKSGRGKALLIIAAVIAVAGVALLAVKPTVGVAVLFVALLTVGISAFMHLKAMIADGASKSDADFEKKEYDGLLSQIKECEDSLTDFFSKLGISGCFEETVYELAAQKKEYDKLNTSVAERKSRLGICAENGKVVRERLDRFFEKYSATATDRNSELIEMRDSLRDYSGLCTELEEKKKRLEEIPTVDEAKLVGAEEYESLKMKERELGPKIDELGTQIGNIDNKIKELSLRADRAAELKNDINILECTKHEQEEQLAVLEKTLELLKKAKEGLAVRYRDPLTDGFRHYSEMMLGEDIGEFILDSEKLKVSLNRSGKAREKSFFSTGYRNLIDIATRLALIDALYKDEKPTVILDDPFVNLDEKRLKNALELLEKVATDRQIIYLTCHESRIPK